MTTGQFKEKLLLMIVDKVVLSVAVALLLWGVKGYLEARKELTDQAIAATCYKSQLLAIQREQLSKTGIEFIQRIEKAEFAGPLEGSGNRCRKLYETLDSVVSTAEMVAPSVREAGRVFVNQAQEMARMVEQRSDREELRRGKTYFHECMDKAVWAFQEAIVTAVFLEKEELAKVAVRVRKKQTNRPLNSSTRSYP